MTLRLQQEKYVGCCHFCWFIPFYGPPYNYDTVLYENMHIELGKDAYTASGRRHDTKLEDMIKKLQCRRLVSALGKRMREHDENGKDTNCEDEDDEVVTHRANTSIHNTTSGVIFEGNNSISEIQELILERDKLKPLRAAVVRDGQICPSLTFSLGNLNFNADLRAILEQLAPLYPYIVRKNVLRAFRICACGLNLSSRSGDK